MLVITEAAQKHFISLLSSQEIGTEIRVLITDVGTDRAKCGVCFCFFDSFKSSDVIINFRYMSVRVERYIVAFLRDSIIDVVADNLGLQITFKAPYARGFSSEVDVVVRDDKSNNDVSFLEERIRNILELKINPQLLVHGGNVNLVKVTEDSVAVLEFSGGCNGCAMAQYTMQLGIETTLKKFFPQLKGVCDVTEHNRGSHSYY